MFEAANYDEWYAAALELDRLEGRDLWRLKKESEKYDFRLIASRVTILRKLRRQKDYDRLMFRLREELHGNLGNMANPALYQEARGGTKKLINDYLDEVSASLRLLCESNVKRLPPMRKRRFLKRAARSFGRSALLLSGGASLGLFHIGVIEELEAHGLLPRVVTGSSAGSIMAGILATNTDSELEALLDPEHIDFEWVRVFKPFDMVKGQSVLDQKLLKEFIDRNIPEITFLEAYQHTNRILNISVSPADSHQFPRLLNYLTAPNVLVRWAALASAPSPACFRKYNSGPRILMVNPWPTCHKPVDRRLRPRGYPKRKGQPAAQHQSLHCQPDESARGSIPERGYRRNGADSVHPGRDTQGAHGTNRAFPGAGAPALRSAGRWGSMIKKAHAMASQTYSGDITIYPEKAPDEPRQNVLQFRAGGGQENGFRRPPRHLAEDRANPQYHSDQSLF